MSKKSLKTAQTKQKAPHKVAERAHRRLKRAKGTQKNDTSTPKRGRRLQKDTKREPKGLPKDTKNDKKT